jgi:catechol 2,3-dioxygenase-like lactoylglutathione lyase family enzyme
MNEIKFSVTAIDCPEPLELARFYSKLCGLEVEPLGDFLPEDVTWIELLNDGHPTIGFQKVSYTVPPTWPEGPQPQRLHLDFLVDDLDIGEAFALELGATKAPFQPGTTFRVFLDPIGHPFCLVQRTAN